MQAEIIIPEWAKFIISDFTDYERNAKKVDSRKVNKIKIELPDDVYFSYGFLDENKKLRSDPNNSIKADTPNYPEMSAIIGPEYQEDKYYNPTAEAEGQVFRQRIRSEYLQENRRIIIYTPYGYEDFELPTIYVHDGVAYYRIAKLANMLEQLLAEDKIRPARLVFVEPKNRLKEYGFDENYQNFIIKELIPFIDKELNTTSERITLGASLGGLVSATLAIKNPDVFTTVVSQSGAFLGSPSNKKFHGVTDSWLLEQITSLDKLETRWYTSVGNIEWLTDINIKIAKELKEKADEFEFAERNIGHNWINWRNGLAKTLEFALET